MTNAGNINNNDIMPSLRSGENVILNEPWTFLPSGSTAQRPTPSSVINYRLRLNTDLQLYEYYNPILMIWVQLEETPITHGPFVTYSADATLPDAQNLGLLADGILKQTISLGIATLNIAVNGTDYYGPGFVIPGTDGGTGVNNGALTINLGSATVDYVLTSDAFGNATWQPASTGGAITTIDGDSGSATPTVGVVSIEAAATGLSFTGSGNTLSLGGLLTPTFGGTGINNGIATIDLTSPTTGFVLTSDVDGNATWQAVSASGAIMTIDGDSGSVVPTAGVVSIEAAATGLSFTGSGSTLSLGGLLSPTFGGTGVSNPTAHGVLISEGASAVRPIVLGAGQILIGTTASDPAAAAISSGTGILVGNASGSITISLAPIATLNILSNITGGAAAPIANTLTATIDAAIGATRGDILFRNATVWTVLAPSTAGFSLQTGGAGADPSYSNTFTNSSLVTPATLGVQQQALNMNNNLINNVSTPVSNLDAANKFYVDQTALTGTSVYAATAATLGTVTQSGAGVGATLTNAGAQAAFVADGATVPVGQNVLVKNTATGMTAANEGIYTLTAAGSGASNWILTRATSYDTAAEINRTGLIVIQNGSTLIGQAWYNAATITTVDTDNFSYSEFGNVVFPISLAHGGTNANLTASNGGIFYSTASAGAILSGTATAGLALLSGASTTPTWSTSPPVTQIKASTFAAGTSTYTPTTGMKYCIVEIVGGGGSGGAVTGGTAGQCSAAGGGGGGGYSRKTYTAANIGASAAVVVGTGGAAASAGANDGNSGGTSSFTPAGTGPTLTCGPGTKGFACSKSAGAQLISAGTGGAASGGDLNIPGQAAGLAATQAAAALAYPGSGGNSALGLGGVGYVLTIQTSQAGAAPSGYGSGSSGASDINSGDHASNAAKDGVCIVTEFISV